MRYLFLALLLMTAPVAHSQSIDDAMVQKSLLILHSTTNYDAALKTARSAASGLGLKLDLRDLKPHKTEGLTWTAAECDSNGWEYPCYVARGRYDDGSYVSIERSDAYEGFTKGYYIVIAASGDSQGADMKAALVKAKKRFRDAYLKSTKVYMGCMH